MSSLNVKFSRCVPSPARLSHALTTVGGFVSGAGTGAGVVVDPPDGRIPALTDAGRALAATRSNGTYSPGPFHDFEDFSLYDRCISRGPIGSIMPAIYGNGVNIAQSPNAVAISYEMIHDTRIIRLDGREAATDIPDQCGAMTIATARSIPSARIAVTASATNGGECFIPT